MDLLDTYTIMWFSIETYEHRDPIRAIEIRVRESLT